jgi:hypothetical protein
MPVMQPETIEAVHMAAVPISVEIDAMLARVPADADLADIADELVAELEAMCDRRDFIDVFNKALIARRALVELGIGV